MEIRRGEGEKPQGRERSGIIGRNTDIKSRAKSLVAVPLRRNA